MSDETAPKPRLWFQDPDEAPRPRPTRRRRGRAPPDPFRGARGRDRARLARRL